MSFQRFDWERVYESNFQGSSSLVGDFYRPILSRAVRYDRLAGYLSLQNLADAQQGIETAFESDGEISIIASKPLGTENNPALTDEAPTAQAGYPPLPLIVHHRDQRFPSNTRSSPCNSPDTVFS